LPPVSDDTTMRLLDLYRHTDPTLARVIEERIDLARIMPGNSRVGDNRPAVQAGGTTQARAYFAEVAGAAASSWRTPMVRVSAHSHLTAGIPITTKAPSVAGCRYC
jgi:uncharacterized protein (DUF1501 family)